jgi:hypothetical protein
MSPNHKYLRCLVFAVCFGAALSCSGSDSSVSSNTSTNTPSAPSDTTSDEAPATCTPANDPSPEVSTPTLRATLPASWDENWYASAAVFDLDHNGQMKIIAGRHSVLYVWNSDGTLDWRAPVGENSTTSNDHGSYRQYASPVVGDLDGDGYGEIVIAWSNKAAVYDHNGIIRSGWPRTFPGSSGEIRSICAANLDGDGQFEILAVSTASGPSTVVWQLNGSVRPGWPQVTGSDPDRDDCGGFNQNIGAADLDGDGDLEVVATYDCCIIGIMHDDGTPFAANAMFADAGPYVSSVPFFHDLNLMMQGWGADGNDRDEFTDSPPVFADMDADSLPEVVLYADHELAGEYVNRGNSLWVINPDLTRVAGFETPIVSGGPIFTGYENNIVQVAPAPAVADILGDATPEIIVPSYDGKMRCFGRGGQTLWVYTFDDAGDPFNGASGPAVADLNGDGISEVVFTTYSVSDNVSHLIILSANGGLLHKIPLTGRGDMSVPTIADVDGDGRPEIIISLKDTLGGGLGGVQIWDVSSARTNCIQWGTGRGGYLRNGRSDRT